MEPFFLVIFLVLLAVFLLWQAGRQQRKTGLPAGRVLYSDPRLIGPPEKPFFDVDARLTGRPDYLVEEAGGLVPVEVKCGWAPDQPRPGHVYQLLAYCLLIERSTGRRPPYGILRYRNRSFAIDYTPAAERSLLDLLDEIHASGARKEQPRSHDEPARCARCGYRSVCDQRL